MNECIVCGTECGKGKTCSSTCRSKLARSVAPTVAKPTVASSVASTETFKDACGNEHKIDYEGRRSNWLMLRSWADGKGTPKQVALGKLSRNYDIAKRPAGLTIKQRDDRFLGCDSEQLLEAVPC